MNRSQEFFRYFSESNIPLPNKIKPKTKIPQYNNEASKFIQQSKEINMRLQNAISVVHQLNSLVNGNNVLGENDPKIQQMIIQLQGELSFVDVQINELEKMPSTQNHTASMAQTLRKSLADVTKEFKQTIQVRGENISKINQRRKKIGNINQSFNNFSTSYSPDEVEIILPQNDLIMTEHLEDRYNMVRDVEISVTKISEMFSKLSQIIASHDYEIERIDQNTRLALDNFTSGQKQLEQYFDKVKNNKWLILKIFAILIVFALVFILIM